MLLHWHFGKMSTTTSALNTFLNFNTSIVRRLLQWKVGNDDTNENWSEKAIKSLVKKLKKSGGLDELEKAISNQGKCIILCNSAYLL